MSRDRPDFPSLAQTLERLPKKRLARFSKPNSNYSHRIAFAFVFFCFFFCICCQTLFQIISAKPWFLIDFQVAFPPHPSVPQCGGALLRLQPSTGCVLRDFLEIFDAAPSRASIPRNSKPLPTSRNCEAGTSDRYQPKHSLVNISVVGTYIIYAASTH